MEAVEKKFCYLTVIYYSRGCSISEAMKKASNLIIKEMNEINKNE